MALRRVAENREGLDLARPKHRPKRRNSRELAALNRKIHHSRDPLAALEAWCEVYEHRQAVLFDLVKRARGDGYSWQEIAHALGMTKQAAHKRWGHLID